MFAIATRSIRGFAVILLGSVCVYADQALATHAGADLTIETPRVRNMKATRKTFLNTGPAVGNVLNVHYFPGLIDYAKGNYGAAIGQMDYVLAVPHYLNGNPRQAVFMSYGHYIRGMIFLYHASGPGRLTRARTDFEQAIRWNPNNYQAYLEMARLFAMANLKEQALQVLRQLLAKQPPEEVAQQARHELAVLQTGARK